MDNKLEYIPGDLVMVKNPSLQFAKDKIFKVISSLSGGFLKIVMLNDSSTTYSISNNAILPIPLTPEILDKNGWKKSKINDCAYFYYKDGLFLTYTSKDDKFWFDDFDYSSSICVYIPYVHSLQHLLFGLGINSEMEVYVWK